MGVLGLVVNIIVLWNTIYIDAVLTQLRQEGYPVRDEDVARLSPFVHERHKICWDATPSQYPRRLLEASSGHCATPTTQMLNRDLRSIAP